MTRLAAITAVTCYIHTKYQKIVKREHFKGLRYSTLTYTIRAGASVLKVNAVTDGVQEIVGGNRNNAKRGPGSRVRCGIRKGFPEAHRDFLPVFIS